jgi:hypothetical protein
MYPPREYFDNGDPLYTPDLRHATDPLPYIPYETNVYDVVIAEMSQIAEIHSLMYPEVRRHMYEQLIVTMYRKFVKGSTVCVNSSVSHHGRVVEEVTEYYPFWSKVKLFCQKNFHATAPFFMDAPPLTFPCKVVVNETHEKKEYWNVIPEEEDCKLRSGRRLQITSTNGWLSASPDDERIELVRELSYQTKRAEYFQRRFFGEPC